MKCNTELLTVQAPAKVNLFLEVTGKRSDGYHDICTVFQKIALYDELQLSLQKTELSLTCTDAAIGPVQDNLVYRAAVLLKEFSGTACGARIHLKKRIPWGAGLGGGSSDAAATLSALNTLWQTRCSPQELSLLGSRLGADVPFFLQDAPVAIGRGRGDELTAADGLPKYWVVVVKPPVSVATGSVYERVCVPLTKRRKDVKLLLYALAAKDLSLLGASLFNRLESVTFRQYRLLKTIKQAVRETGAVAALMSGSGSVLFGIFSNKKEALRAQRELNQYGNVFAISSL